MASPISFTIELRRCWTTERVMGSILADILTRSSKHHRQSVTATSASAPDAASMIACISASVIGVHLRLPSCLSCI